MNRTLEHILPKVQKPARYTGGEYNAVVKDKRTVDTRFALCFPDTYEIGMSNLGCRILYGLMNEQEGLWCERCYAPWGDMEEEMRREGLLLYALESGDPISDFDIIGFSLGYEMAYTNVLNMLDLAGLPLRSEQRPELTPLIVAGGTCCYNPEPLAPFVDLFVLGEGEEVTLEYIALYRQAKEECWSKEEFLREAAQIEGIYVPSFYEPVYRPDGTLEEMRITRGLRCAGAGAQAGGTATWTRPTSRSKPSSPPPRSSTTASCWSCSVAASVVAGSARRAMCTARCATAILSCWPSTARRPARIPATRR